MPKRYSNLQFEGGQRQIYIRRDTAGIISACYYGRLRKHTSEEYPKDTQGVEVTKNKALNALAMQHHDQHTSGEQFVRSMLLAGSENSRSGYYRVLNDLSGITLSNMPLLKLMSKQGLALLKTLFQTAQKAGFQCSKNMIEHTVRIINKVESLGEQSCALWACFMACVRFWWDYWCQMEKLTRSEVEPCVIAQDIIKRFVSVFFESVGVLVGNVFQGILALVGGISGSFVGKYVERHALGGKLEKYIEAELVKLPKNPHCSAFTVYTSSLYITGYILFASVRVMGLNSLERFWSFISNLMGLEGIMSMPSPPEMQ